MKLKKAINALIILFEGVLFSAMISVAYLAFHHMAEEKRLEHDYTLMVEYATRLKDSSEELTRFARMYSVTQDEAFKEKYYKVLKIRKGEVERPYNYNWYYWYQGRQSEGTEATNVKKISLKRLLKSLPFEKEDIIRLESSEKHSDKLAMIEIEAFKLIDSKLPKNIKKAQELLHSTDYRTAKMIIMEGIGVFTLAAKERTERVIAEHSEGIVSNFIFLSLFVFIFIVGNVFIYFYLSNQDKILSSTKDQLLESSKLAQIGKLAAGVGHEINNPLSIILGNLDMLKATLKPLAVVDNKMVEKVAKIEKACRRITHIVDGLRVYSNTTVKDAEELSINKVLDECHMLVEDIFQVDQIELELIGSDKDLIAEITYTEIQQVIMNLLANAKDAMEGQKGKLVTMSLTVEREMIKIQVDDNGPGISKKNLKKVFDPFFTTKDVGQGTGIGLGVSQELLKKAGGRMEVLSEEGIGTTVVVYLPLKASREVIVEEVIEQPESTVGNKVLVVEDEEDIREFVVLFLEDCGYVVEEASNGEEGLELIQKNNYDIVCTDIKMPYMRGDEMLTKAREISGRETKYVIMTGGVEMRGKEEAKRLREICDRLIYKPFDKNELIDIFTEVATV